LDSFGALDTLGADTAWGDAEAEGVADALVALVGAQPDNPYASARATEATESEAALKDMDMDMDMEHPRFTKRPTAPLPAR
jgi:hypothetical protein